MDRVVSSCLEIAGRKIGAGHPCFVIAEAGVNHNGRLRIAKKLVDVAVEAKADAVKFQTFKTEKLVSVAGKSQREMLKRLELSEEAHGELWDYCKKRRILFLSTPFEEESADFLEQLGVSAFKISSGELTNLPFLAHLARKGRPLILSTGMSVLEEVREAVEVIRREGNDQLALLHCVSSYPAQPSEANLRVIHTLQKVFEVPVGYSDHTMGIEVALAAVALGACVIEKHVTLNRRLPGPDHHASLEPLELKALVRGIRAVEPALGDGRKEPAPSERPTAAVARKSLVALKTIAAGSQLTPDLVAIQRPGTGLPPMMLPRVLGRSAACDIPAGTPLTEEMLGRRSVSPYWRPRRVDGRKHLHPAVRRAERGKARSSGRATAQREADPEASLRVAGGGA